MNNYPEDYPEYVNKEYGTDPLMTLAWCYCASTPFLWTLCQLLLAFCGVGLQHERAFKAANDPETLKQRVPEIPSLREKLEVALFSCLEIVLPPRWSFTSSYCLIRMFQGAC